MRIPEYDKRIIAETTPRTKLSIDEPKELRDTTHLDKQAKKFGNAINDAGEAFISMKKERDMGIVNEFMNEFGVNSSKKIAELKQKYKGRNSLEVVEAYQRWQDGYVGERIGYSQSSEDGVLYLENNEQIKSARKQLMSSLEGNISTLSTYAAKELKDYSDKQYDGRIFALQQAIAQEDSIPNINIDKGQIYSLIQEKYPNAPKSYIDMEAKKAYSLALESGINRMIIDDPFKAGVALQTSEFKNGILAEKYNGLRENVVNKLLESESSHLAEMWSKGYDGSYTLNNEQREIIKPLLGTYDENEFTGKVLEEAKKKLITLEKSIKEATAMQNNQYTTDLATLSQQLGNKVTPYNERQKNEQALAQITTEMKKTPEGQKQYMLWDETNKGVNEFDYSKNLAKNVKWGDIGKWSPEELSQAVEVTNKYEENFERIKGESKEVGKILDQIDLGTYTDYESFDLEKLHPVNRAIVLDAIAKNQKYKALDYRAKRKGYDLEKVISLAYSGATGAKPQDSLARYNAFKMYMKDEMINYASSNKGELPSQSDVALLGSLASRADSKIYENNNATGAIILLSEKIPMIKADLKKGTSSASEGKFSDFFRRGEPIGGDFINSQELVINLIDQMDSDAFDGCSDADKLSIAEQIKDGNINGAVRVLQECQND